MIITVCQCIQSYHTDQWSWYHTHRHTYLSRLIQHFRSRTGSLVSLTSGRLSSAKARSITQVSFPTLWSCWLIFSLPRFNREVLSCESIEDIKKDTVCTSRHFADRAFAPSLIKKHYWSVMFFGNTLEQRHLIFVFGWNLLITPVEGYWREAFGFSSSPNFQILTILAVMVTQLMCAAHKIFFWRLVSTCDIQVIVKHEMQKRVLWNTHYKIWTMH